MAEKRVLLPKNVHPESLDIHLTPDFTSFTFAGVEKVTLKVKEATDIIVVNGLEVTVTKAALNGAEAVKIDHDATAETITMRFPSPVAAGTTAILDIVFTGILNDKLAGFYRSKYEHEGQTKWLATTQFEPADARMAFPCWDEPAVKSVWRITLTVPSDMVALSNMPAVKTQDHGDGKKTVAFAETPIVSAYLIAFCVGHFECLETKSKAGIDIRVWTTPGKKSMGEFALDVGAKVIDYFSEYYQIPYPLPKEDMIAIPDFSAGAMENWGLITYRETALLCDVKTASVAAKSRIAYVIAHELAHQWFGNLVTMEWWKELWLNEGFATFVGTQAIGHFFPEWQVWTQFLTDYVARALSVDSLRNSHPIEVDVATARSISEIFDAISYCKGASVIRMIENFLGEESFRKGLNIYLNRFKYGNAVTKDLWKGLSDGSGKDVSGIMDKWTSTIGYPVVTVEETQEMGTYTVTQNRFLASGDPKPEEDATIWHINIGIASHTQRKIEYVDLTKRSDTIHVKITNKNEWVKFNAGQSGFYRVAYPKEMSARLGEAIKRGELSAADRHGIQSDAFALARAGTIPLAQALALVQNYLNETDYTVWTDLSANLGEIATLLDGSDASPYFDKYMLALYAKISSLGWDPVPDEADLHKQLRGTILNKLAAHGNTQVESEATSRFGKFLSDPKSLSADLQGVVFKTAMRAGGDSEFDSMVETYKAATQPELRIRALQCIGFSKKPELIQKALEYSLTDHVRTQDTMYLFASAASTAHGRDLSWRFLKTHWDTFTQKLGGGMNLLGHVIKASAASGSTQAWLDDVEGFFKTHTATGTERTIQQVIESIRGNVAYITKNRESVTAWLKENTK